MKDSIRWLPLFLIAALAFAWGAETSRLVSLATEPVPQAPLLAITLPGSVTEIIDGDTLTVEVRLPIRVRLLGAWAPELREPGGTVARDRLKVLAAGRRCTVHVPLSGARRLDDVFTFGRLLAHVWVDGEPRSLSQVMVGEGLATKEKIP